MEHVNRDTRAGRNGKRIICPSCKATSTVYHFAWSALSCNVCDADVQKNDWLINKEAVKEAVKGRGWERDAEGRDSLQLTPQQNETMTSIFSSAEWVWVDKSNEGFAQAVLTGDQRVNDNSEKAIARMNGILWGRLMQLKKEGLAKNIFDDDEALFISVPLEIARIFHDVEGDE